MAQPEDLPFTPLILVSASQPCAYERKFSPLARHAVALPLRSKARGAVVGKQQRGRQQLRAAASIPPPPRLPGEGCSGHGIGRGFFSTGTREQYGTRCTACTAIGTCGAADGKPDEGLPCCSCCDGGGSGSGSDGGAGSRTDDEEGASQQLGGNCWSYIYVPGAGDDEESWAAGLTPRLFWANYRVSEGRKGVPAGKCLFGSHVSARFAG